MKTIQFLLAGLVLLACSSGKRVEYETIGSIDRLDPGLDEVIKEGAQIEIVAEGFNWAEGPLWLKKENKLIFSDVPENTIFQWTEKDGISVYLKPSGYTGTTPRGGEMGSNGLTLNSKGQLVLAQHGNRQIALMEAPLDKPAPAFKALATGYNGKRLSSPNDVILNSKDEVFFTDPPYGLIRQNDSDPEKETPFNGVYKVGLDGTVYPLVDSLARPNGIAFSPDQHYLYVSNSDARKARWYKYELDGNTVKNGKVFYDVTSHSREGGVCDGMKVDSKGYVFGTGPGGVWIFSGEGKLLGRIRIPQAVSNCAFSPDEKTLYMTSDNYLLRLKMR